MLHFKRVLLALLATLTALVVALPATTSHLPSGVIAVPLVRNTGLSAYYAEFQIGTPPQKEFVKVDTGSPRYGFLDPRNPSCTSDPKACSTFGSFDNLTSSTSIYEGPGFEDALIDYGNGDFLNDTVALGGVSVEHLYFGYVSDYSFPDHVVPPIATIAGLALDCDYGGPNCTNAGPYLLPQLKNASAINYMATSFYLGPDDANTTCARMIIGGAYDEAKVDGELFTVNMVDPRSPALSNGETNWVNVTAMEFVQHGGNKTVETYGAKDIGVPVLLDTGSANWYLTNSMFDVVWRALGGVGDYNPQTEYQVVDCKYRDAKNSKSYLAAVFGKAGKIKVPLHSLVSQFADGTCASFIYPRGDTVGIFGDTFLRGAYVIYDQEKFTVSLGQVKHTDEEKIVAFPKGGSRVSS